MTLTPRPEPFDASAWEIPHPAPYLCDIAVDETPGSSQLSRAVAHVSNIEYVRWLDRGAELHADSLGCTRESMLQQNIMWFVARHEIDYVAEAHPGDALVLATWVRDMRRVKSWRDTVVVRPADETVVCRAATLWVLVDLETRRPTRIDAAMAARFAPLHPPRTGSACTSA